MCARNREVMLYLIQSIFDSFFVLYKIIFRLFESVARSCNSATTYKGTPGSGPSSADSNLISQNNQLA